MMDTNAVLIKIMNVLYIDPNGNQIVAIENGIVS